VVRASSWLRHRRCGRDHDVGSSLARPDEAGTRSSSRRPGEATRRHAGLDELRGTPPTRCAPAGIRSSPSGGRLALMLDARANFLRRACAQHVGARSTERIREPLLSQHPGRRSTQEHTAAEKLQSCTRRRLTHRGRHPAVLPRFDFSRAALAHLAARQPHFRLLMTPTRLSPGSRVRRSDVPAHGGEGDRKRGDDDIVAFFALQGMRPGSASAGCSSCCATPVPGLCWSPRRAVEQST
jgi:hypothetical protein